MQSEISQFNMIFVFSFNFSVMCQVFTFLKPYIIMFAVRRYLQGCLQSNINISTQKEDKPEEKNILSRCFRWQKCEVV